MSSRWDRYEPPDVTWEVQAIEGRIAVVQVGGQPTVPLNLPTPSRRAGGWRQRRCCWAWPSMEAAQADADRLNAEQAAARAKWAKRQQREEAA